MRNCKFYGNRAEGLYAEGGALYNRGTATLIDCEFFDNYVSYQGGAIVNAKSLTMSGGTIRNNEAASK